MIKKHCSSKWKLFLDENKYSSYYKKDNLIFAEGSMISGIFFVYQGKLKLFSEKIYGRQHLINLAMAGELLEPQGYDEKKYHVGCVALEDTTLCFFEKEIFFRMLRKNPELSISLFNEYAHELEKIKIRQKHFSHLSSAMRVAEMLLLLRNKCGVPLENGILIDVNLTRPDIADLVETTPEEAIRVLSRFKKDGIIDTAGKKIILLEEQILKEMIIASYYDEEQYKELLSS
ncbi:MAG TPA: Crp/Fnr family transcriptional regulator [Bacteroidia bacterium]